MWPYLYMRQHANKAVLLSLWIHWIFVMNTYINNSDRTSWNVSTLHISPGLWSPSIEEVPTCPWLTQSIAHWPPEAFVYLLHLGQLSPCVLIVPQVLLVPHQDDGNIGAEVLHLRRPLLRDIFCPGRDKKWAETLEREGGRGGGRRTIKKGQAVQSHGAEHFSWWIALQTARGKDVFSCTNPTSHQVH